MHCTNQTGTTLQDICPMLKMENGVSGQHLSYTQDSLHKAHNNMAQNRVLTYDTAMSSYM